MVQCSDDKNIFSDSGHYLIFANTLLLFEVQEYFYYVKKII